MKKILFVYDHNRPERLKEDGLWKALNLLEKDFKIERVNIAPGGYGITPLGYDFILGWGAFTSVVDEILIRAKKAGAKTGLCLSAYMQPNEFSSKYDVIFYETECQRKFLDEKGVKTKLIHAFGINTDIFHPMSNEEVGYEMWDNISVGSFTKWHRQDLLYDISGNNLAVGEINPENMQVAFNYISNLLLRNWTVSNWVEPQILAQYYNMSKKLVATADFGQERACLEARACGIEVSVPQDNPKLKELTTSPIWDLNYYYQQLKGGIESVIG